MVSVPWCRKALRAIRSTATCFSSSVAIRLLLEDWRIPTLESAASSIFVGRRLSKLSKGLIHQLLLPGVTVDYRGQIGKTGYGEVL